MWRPDPVPGIRRISCPTDVAGLAPIVLRDLPSYANRVSSRAQVQERSFNPRGVVIAAAQDEADEAFNAALPVRRLSSDGDSELALDLDLEGERIFSSPGLGLSSALEQDLSTHQLIPFFFTTLERQYVDDQAVRLQHYHWAFLSQTAASQTAQSRSEKTPQWHLAMMFSRLGDYPADQPVAPPRESRQGSIGQALQLWLRDCNVGSVAAQSENLN